jgi:hypothetical protein
MDNPSILFTGFSFSLLRGLAYGNLAGDEKGLVASTTNITKECKSVEPLLETCIGVLAP